MTLHFRHSFDGLLWRVFPDIRYGLLVAEVRHPDRTVSFAAVEVATGRVRWQGVRPAEAWWSSGIGVQDGLLLLQTYPEGHNPDPRGITALDTATGRIVWTQPHGQLVRWQGHGLLLRDPAEAAPPYWLAAATGRPLPAPPPPDRQQRDTDRLLFPVAYPSGTPYFDFISRFLSDSHGILPRNSVEYAEFAGFVVVSYYIYAAKQVENHLLVLDTQSRVPLLHEPLAAQRTGIGKDTFFLFDSFLIFIQEQTFLLSYAT